MRALIFKITLLILSTFLLKNCYSQLITSNGRWSYYRWEYGFGIGASNFLGDLGGRDMIGSDFIYDLEISRTHPSLTCFVSYFMHKRIMSRGQLTYAKVSGDDALTQEYFRNNRNLHFESNILEASYLLHLKISQENTMLPGAALKQTFIGRFFDEMEVYGLGGVGVFYFNPKTRLEDGTKINLKPLRTEGQGLPGGPEEYNRVNISIPIGIGFKKSFRNSMEWGVQLEILYRFTFTDYIDDVSTIYYDKTYLSQQVSPLSAEMSDRSNVPSRSTSTGEQRGDPSDNDGYLTVSLCINRNRARNFRRKIKNHRFF